LLRLICPHQATGEWNGLIKDLIADKADIVTTTLSLTDARSRVVDFTVPFYHEPYYFFVRYKGTKT
jgi:ABC-type amino acid transport substrate-binding protein